MDDRLFAQLGFLKEIDRLKTVLRQTLLMDKSKRENDAEHSWHLAVMAMLLREYASEDVNLDRVIKMTLVHDLVEIDAGDTFAFDAMANESKALREALAADRIFGMLPGDQGGELRTLWEEFEAMETPDARFAAAMDRFQPFMHNTQTEGYTWKLGGVTKEQVYKRVGIVKLVCPGLWSYVEASVADAVEKGYIRE